MFVSHFPASRLSEQTTPDRVSVYDRHGKVVREWGSSGTDDGQFSWPGGIAISRSGRVYVADQTNRRVQVQSPYSEIRYRRVDPPGRSGVPRIQIRSPLINFSVTRTFRYRWIAASNRASESANWHKLLARSGAACLRDRVMGHLPDGFTIRAQFASFELLENPY
jgi:DNA-binding beta-propeller fold protein YncE